MTFQCESEARRILYLSFDAGRRDSDQVFDHHSLTHMKGFNLAVGSKPSGEEQQAYRFRTITFCGGVVRLGQPKREWPMLR